MSKNNKSPLPGSMKAIIALLIFAVMGVIVWLASMFIAPDSRAKDVFVDGHIRSDGTYVQPYHRSAPDNSQYNNYGTQGNYNPYTGQQGTVQPQPYMAQQPQYNPYGNNRGQSAVGR